MPSLKGDAFAAEDIFIESNSRDDFLQGNTGQAELADSGTEKSLSSPSMRTVISKEGWKLSLSNRGNSQLFDLNSDPLETTNLFYKEGHAEIIQELSRKIEVWQTSTKDPLALNIQ